MIVLEQQKPAMINSLPRCGEGRDTRMMCFGGYPNQQLQETKGSSEWQMIPSIVIHGSVSAMPETRLGKR